MSGTLTQIFPPAPSFTEARLKDLSGKVFIVTGSNSGIGFELAKILYQKNGSVYIASRSLDKIEKAIRSIQEQFPKSRGKLSALKLNLADLKSIKASAGDFLAKSDRLDVIFHNAGVMTPPANSKSPLGHDLEMATNCLGPFLLNSFLEPILKKTAASSERDSVRVVWLASLVNVGTAAGGIVFDEATGAPKVLKNAMENYMQTKVGNVFLAHESAKGLGADGVISLSVNPGLMKTELQRHGPAAQGVIMKALFKGPQYGAYSELYAGLSPDIKSKENGGFIIPWGRFGILPDDISKGLKSKSQGGTGAAQKFWDWAEKQTQAYR